MGLLEVLERSRTLGFLGPGPVERHIAHAEAFARAAPAAPVRSLDLGSGGGVPGLVLAASWPSTTFVLLDAQAKRAEFLRRAVLDLGLAERMTVRQGRAEVLGREPYLRAQFDVVTARSFGPPAVTAECGASFLQVSGLLLVAEPPEDGDERWPAAGLAELGLADEGVVRVGDATVRRLRLVERLPDRYPRADGVPAKRPLF